MDKAAENCISSAAMDKLIAAHDGDVALLYLYLLRRPFDPEEAARELCRTGGEIAAAAEKLRRLGVFPDRGQPCGSADSAPVSKLPPAEELPEYTAGEIAGRSAEDGTFQAVVAETQRIMGRALSGADMKTLFGIYDYLALPPDVILELLNFCVDRSREKYGPGKLPSMRSIEKEAFVWANMEILTFEQAEEYIRSFRARQDAVAKAAQVLNIRGRELSSTERKYLSSWLDMSFGPDALAIAYDRTVTNTGSLKWQYMNKILLSWHEKGLRTAAEIEEKDGRRRTASPSAPVQQNPGRDSLIALKNKMNGSR
jgi:DnaD/phage-associated family protein